MGKKMPSIFNDVIGPVMRGPSSSHTAASWRIARVSLDILNDPLKKALIEFEQNSAWASNFREQGTVMGINGGLLGFDITDDRMKDAETLDKDMGVEITYRISTFPTTHTNTIRLSLEGKKGKKVQVLAVSVGGGAFQIQKIDDFEVNIRGDYYDVLIRIKQYDKEYEEIRSIIPESVFLYQASDNGNSLLNLKSSKNLSLKTINLLGQTIDIDEVIVVKPILPIVSGKGEKLPFDSIESLCEYARINKMDLGEIGLLYEKCRSGLSENVLLNKMRNNVEIIDTSIKRGLKGTICKDRILPHQSHLIERAARDKKIIKNLMLNNTIAYVSAIMEAKSAMEVIIANPTAGSCGTIGGVLRAVADDLGLTINELAKAYFAAGIIGTYFAQGPGFSAEEHGCQVECGAASGMAAAGIVQLMGRSAKDAIDAASMAIQNMIGLVCDPVADRVEVPCLGKNISAAMNALSSATMVCAGFDAVIPLNEVINTVSQVGKLMPTCVKCTGQGGLAITPTSIKLKKSLES
jgi:L-serine dehydratase